ncbi:hypothetical protein MKW94_004832 [Papaver nudicaule]|uniref:Uncharacterized protein n=1 Tax=Papaver nudicaule TaxID=74823 RepID=A0AA41RTR2_PAPNU|nr:hypothetical protein [Papaver nudicaule]
MKVIAAYLLAVLGGNKEPTAEDIKEILGSVGADENSDDRIALLLSQLKGKELTELIACGREKLASVGGGPAASMAVAVSVGGGSVNGGAAEQKKEEKVEEKEEEELDEDMGFSLFESDDEN